MLTGQRTVAPTVVPKKKPAPAIPPPVKRGSKLPLWISGIGFYCIAVYGIYVYAVNQGDPIDSKPVEQQEDKRMVFDDIAKKYDEEMSSNEWWMGMLLLRRSLTKRAEVILNSFY